MIARLVSKTMVDSDYVDSLIDVDEVDDIKTLEWYREIKRNPELLMIYIARVSSPNQLNPDYTKLLKYCWTHGHVSVFEQVSLTMEVETDLNIAMQLLRHGKGFNFQMLSRRYSSNNIEFMPITARRQDEKNRQSSLEDLSEEDKTWFLVKKEMLEMHSKAAYEEAIQRGIAKETARYLLLTSLKTKLYVTGPLRSFLTYIKVREHESSQKEHRDLALAIKKEIKRSFPVTYQAVWED